MGSFDPVTRELVHAPLTCRMGVPKPAQSYGWLTRTEFLNGPLFETLLEAQVLLEDWRVDYNCNRPDSAHGWLTPVEFVEAWLNRQQLQLAIASSSTNGIRSLLPRHLPIVGSFKRVMLLSSGSGKASPATRGSFDSQLTGPIISSAESRMRSPALVSRFGARRVKGQYQFRGSSDLRGVSGQGNAEAGWFHLTSSRPHQTLTRRYGRKTTPAMAAGVEDHVWSVWEIAGLLD
jgi:hypothetical protein